MKQVVKQVAKQDGNRENLDNRVRASWLRTGRAGEKFACHFTEGADVKMGIAVIAAPVIRRQPSGFIRRQLPGLYLSLFLCIPALNLLAAPVQDGTVLFKADVRLVHVMATVRDGTGRLVGNLRKQDFEITEGGESQRIAIFQRESDLSLSIALLMDASLSTAKELEFETASAVGFLGSVLRPSDRAAVYRFARDVQELTRYSANLKIMEEAIRGIRPSGGTSLYDALYLAARELQKREGRKAIVVITDGGDTTSRKGFHEALRAVHLADAALYSIAVIPIPGESGRNTGGEHALISLSQATGGAFYSQYSATGLDAAFARIEEELRTQYVLGYYPSRPAPRGRNRRGTVEPQWIPIEVRAKNPSFTVKARKGYYEGGASAPVEYK